ncbi:hypothetical protein LIT38_10720 [Bacillus sp. CMF12]|uniref:hypothetical protein n=1 Tax=Bacillaceae TaxID=186817 RepID=UPI001FB35E65|nr:MULTISPECIES: hypothetical protein [Bacillaceae]MDF2039960.1 hypothetical protein [Cytobacillus oceanisediminis]UOE57417.1 hypothetical protein IRB79_12025 [Cytobacillus oceanisediminis]USK51877.1 hypothetical protein LIT38_10720 [Bacillus sp. CMF12]
MKVYEVIEAQEMFRGEIIEDYYIIYEQTENKVFESRNNHLFQQERFLEETVNVFKGNPHSTLKKVKTYPIRHLAFGDIRETIRKDFPGLFKNLNRSLA